MEQYGIRHAVKITLGVWVCLLLATGCKWGVSPQDEESAVFSLRFYPSTVEIEGVDNLTTVDVMVDKAKSLIATKFTISFDPSIVEVTKIITGGYSGFIFEDAGAEIEEIERTIDNENGKVVIGLGALKKGFQGADDGGSLAIITFKSKSLGESDLVFVSEKDDDLVTSIYSARNEKGWLELHPITYKGKIVVKEQKKEEPKEEESQQQQEEQQGGQQQQ